MFYRHQLQNSRKRNRLPKFDYSQPGYYFITFCTRFMVEWFGDINNGHICLNDLGSIVCNRLLLLEQNFACVKIDTWVVMPNHVHMIVVVNQTSSPLHQVGTTLGLSLQYQRRYNVLSKTINTLKTTSSKLIHQQGYKEFSWQRSFYDRIIRNEQELFATRKYILNNPKNWKNK